MAALVELKEKIREIRDPTFDSTVQGNEPVRQTVFDKEGQYILPEGCSKPFVICVGGSFSPPTQAHLEVAKIAAEHALSNINEKTEYNGFNSIIVYIVPLKHTYLKDSVVFPGSNQHRLNMLQLCVNKMNGHIGDSTIKIIFRVSDIEIDPEMFKNSGEDRHMNYRMGLEVNTYKTLDKLIGIVAKKNSGLVESEINGALVFGQDNVQNIVVGSWKLDPMPFFNRKMFGIKRGNDPQTGEPAVLTPESLIDLIPFEIDIQNDDETNSIVKKRIDKDSLSAKIVENFEPLNASTLDITTMSSSNIRDLLSLRENPDMPHDKFSIELKEYLTDKDVRDDTIFTQALTDLGFLYEIGDYIKNNNLYGVKTTHIPQKPSKPVELSGGRRRTKTQKRRTRRVRRTRRRRRHSRRKL
jgi:nicotinic acid mononucleotide adenylyltransferase